MKQRTMLALASLLVIGSVGFVAAELGDSGARDLAAVEIDGAASFPNETLTDWVSYAHQVSAATVISERIVDEPGSVNAAGEGYLSREVTLRIDATIWSVDRARPLGETVRLLVPGFVVRGGRRVPAQFPGAPRFEVGSRYVLPLALREDGPSLLSPDTALLLDDRTITVEGRNGRSTAALEAASGHDLEALAEMLGRTAPDPIAVRYWHLPPYERGRAVTDAKAARTGP
jgi:hypothetical protein